MKNFIFFFYIIFFLVNNIAYSQNISYANLDVIIKKSEVGKKIISYFSEKNQKIIKELKNNELQIREKEKKLISQKNLLQEEDFSKKVNDIKLEIEDFNIKSKEKVNNLKNERQVVSNAFLVEINKVIKDYAEKNNIDMILSSNQMLIGKSSLDLTEEILQEVNKSIKNFKIN